MSRQLALGITLRENIDLDNYVPGANRQPVADLRASVLGTGEGFLYLWGDRATGKSHLLQSACRLADEAGRSSVYIPLDQHLELQPELLADLEQLHLVCLDDLHLVVGEAHWEQALFHLFNRIRDGGGRLVVSARSSPAALTFDLADLNSRMSWGLSYQLQPLGDQDKRQALIEGALRRGMEMSAEVADYILRYSDRGMDSLRSLLERLDRASLEAQRRLTIPFVKALLNPAQDE